MPAKFVPELPFNVDFTKYLADLKFPNLDIEAYIAAQRKNVEALSQANRTAYDGLQAIAKRQIEIVRQSLDQASAAAREVVEPGTPQDKAAKQAELAKVSKANSEAFDLLQTRFTQSLDEVRDHLVKLGGK